MRQWSFALVVTMLWCVTSARAADFTGNWKTNYGLLKLVQKGGKVTGTYYDGKASLDGVVTGKKLAFTYIEKGQKGTGHFILSDDGKSISGKFRSLNGKNSGEWNGTRRR